MGESNFIKLLPLNMDKLTKKHVVLETGKKIEKASITESEKEALIALWSKFPETNDELDIKEYKNSLSSLKRLKSDVIIDNLDLIISVMDKTEKEKSEMIKQFYYYEIIPDYYGQYTYYFDMGEGKNVVDILSSIFLDAEALSRRIISNGIYKDNKTGMYNRTLLEELEEDISKAMYKKIKM